MSTSSGQRTTDVPFVSGTKAQADDLIGDLSLHSPAAATSTTSKVTRIALLHPNTPIINSDKTTYFDTMKLEIWSSGDQLEDTSVAGVTGSLKPASVDVNAASATLYVSFDKDDNISETEFTLIGTLRGQEIANGTGVFVGKEEQAVTLTAKQPGTPWGYAGDIQWTLKGDNKEYQLNSTRVEIYGLSSSMPDFFKKDGTPVKFLRYFALPEPKLDYLAWAATTCMTDFWFRYDTVKGAARYAGRITGGTFRLAYWLDTMFLCQNVNSRDQAGILQLALCLQLGSPAKTWAHMEQPDPSAYMYINKTQLAGIGQCNNPFYNRDRDTSKRLRPARRCVDTTDPERTAFGNLAFIMVDGKVLDASCGPHTGSETPAEYIKAAFDSSRSTTATTDITLYSGITSLDVSKPSSSSGSPSATLSLHLEPGSTATATSTSPITEAVDRTMHLARVPDPPAIKFSNANLASLGRLLAAENPNFRLIHQSTDAGRHGTETRFIFREDSADMDGPEARGFCTLRLNLCSDHASALGTMRQHLAAYDRPLEDVFARMTTTPRRGQASLDGQGVTAWVRGDVFAVLEADGSDVRALAERVDGFLEAGEVDSWQDVRLPGLGAPIAEVRGVEGGREFVVRPQVRDVAMMGAKVGHGNVLLLSADVNEKRFRFLALSPGEDDVFLHFVHPETLRVLVERVTVTVVPAREGA